MLCYEVMLNGAKICVAGHTNARWLDVSLRSHRGTNTVSLRVDADLVETSQYIEDVRWADLPVRIGDELFIRVIDSATADLPKHVRSFGRRISPTGETEDSCSFCGKKSEVCLIKGVTGNICDECVALCQEIVEEEIGKRTADSKGKGTEEEE